jgi:hypothetical protein
VDRSCLGASRHLGVDGVAAVELLLDVGARCQGQNGGRDVTALARRGKSGEQHSAVGERGEKVKLRSGGGLGEMERRAVASASYRHVARVPEEASFILDVRATSGTPDGNPFAHGTDAEVLGCGV